MARGFEFQSKEEEGLYYLCSKNKGSDQLCGNCTAGLHLCFHICKSRFSYDVTRMHFFTAAGAPINPGSIPSVLNLANIANRTSVGGGISPVNFSSTGQQVGVVDTNYN